MPGAEIVGAVTSSAATAEPPSPPHLAFYAPPIPSHLPLPLTHTRTPRTHTHPRPAPPCTQSAEHAVLATLKRAPSELSSYQRKTFKIDDHLGIAISGLTADGRILCRYMRNECLNHRWVLVWCARFRLRVRVGVGARGVVPLHAQRVPQPQVLVWCGAGVGCAVVGWWGVRRWVEKCAVPCPTSLPRP